MRNAILSRAKRAAENLLTVLFPSDCRTCGTPFCNVSRLPVCSECLDGIQPLSGKFCSEAIMGLESGCGKTSVAVVAVPLHKTRLCQRGFNQPEVMARAALKLKAADGRLRFSEGTLVRRRETRSQIGMTPHQGRESIRGAFAVVRPGAVKGREILLVDDVYTTGATASECARVLIRAGAARVWVASVARTPRLASQYAQIEPGDDVVEDFAEQCDATESREVAIAGR